MAKGHGGTVVECWPLDLQVLYNHYILLKETFATFSYKARLMGRKNYICARSSTTNILALPLQYEEHGLHF
jgi:hypothetical protein